MILLLLLILTMSPHYVECYCSLQYNVFTRLYPLPSYCESKNITTMKVNPENFNIVLSSTSNIATEANHNTLLSIINRYKTELMFVPVEYKRRGQIEPHLGTKTPSYSSLSSTPTKYLDQIVIQVNDNRLNSYKSLETNESYSIHIDGESNSGTITSESIYGVLYGLETYTQLLHHTLGEYIIQNTPLTIHDSPKYPHRGLLIDSANHFLPMKTIYETLDMMSFVKLNVLHWHIVGSYSFPMDLNVVKTFEGAWSGDDRTMYSIENMKDIVTYANERGIRVVPEFDVPGHTYSLGLAFPNDDITLECPSSVNLTQYTDVGRINVVSLNPTSAKTMPIVRSIFDEMRAVFPDEYVHTGGDEWQHECWDNSSLVHDYMKHNHIDSVSELYAMIETNILEHVKSNRKPIVWGDVYQQNSSLVLHLRPTVEVWQNASFLQKLLDTQAVDVINAQGWYLDVQKPVVDDELHWFWLDVWIDMHNVVLPPYNKDAKGRMLGGEASMWSEQVNYASFNARVWPRALGISEALWSSSIHNHVDGDVASRLAFHRCEMASRGGAIGPIWSDFCGTDLGSTQVSSSSDRIHMSKSAFAWCIIITIIISGCCGGIIYKVYHHDDDNDNNSENIKQQSSPHDDVNIDNVPLLPSPPPSNNNNNDEEAEELQQKKRSHRVLSLDVFRGITIATMILVDNAGAAFPQIDHSPWNGVRLADFVMPCFDFIVGISVVLSLKKHTESHQKQAALYKIMKRFFKLFMLGIATQGGINFLEYDLSRIRIMGILQRVALCYLTAALCELYTPKRFRIRNAMLLSIVLCCLHSIIMYGIHVPSRFGLSCGAGKLTPPCNAATYFDEKIFTINHMYFPTNGGNAAENDVTFQRLPECSICSPGKCKRPPHAPLWCDIGPFDPEGMVSSLTAVVASLIGMYYGDVLINIPESGKRLIRWLIPSIALLLIGLILHFTSFIQMNTDLYSISFLFVTNGVGGIVLCIAYIVVDVYKPYVGTMLTLPFLYLGSNAIIMYVLAEGGIIQWFFSWFWWNNPNNNLTNILFPTGVFWGDDDTKLPEHPSHNIYALLWTIGYIILWCFVAYVMYKRNIFIKI